MEETKELYLKTLMELVSKQLTNKTQPLQDNFFIAKVVDNLDPDKTGKVKVKVIGLMDALKDEDCPWATPDHAFVGSLQSSFVVPPVGSEVRCFFQNNDHYNIFYTHRVMNQNYLPEERLDDYPDSIVLFKTDPGDYWLINTKTNEMIIRSAAGQTIKFTYEGTIELETMNTLIGNIYITARNLLKFDARFIQAPAGSVVPIGTGPFQAFKFDPLTGAPCSGNYFVRQG